jgi:hypothetical protein
LIKCGGLASALPETPSSNGVQIFVEGLLKMQLLAVLVFPALFLTLQSYI